MVFLVNFLFFGLLVPFFKWIYSADYISNRLVLQIVVLFIGELIWLLVYAHSLEKYCYKLNQKNSDLAGIIFCILHLIFAIVIRKKIVVINYWNFSLVICSIGFVICCLYSLSLKNEENKALDEKKKKEIEDARKAEEERIERQKRLAEKNSEIEARKREEEENRRLFSSEK